MNPSNALRLGATLIASLVVAASTVHAQFGLDKLKKTLDKATSATQQATGATQKVTDTTQKVTDAAKDAGKMMKGVLGIGPEEERLIGESVALEIIGKYGGVVRDEEITRRVNLLGQAMAYYSSRPTLTWKFAVLDSSEINGFSAPDGFVFLTRGLYEKVAASDDALAAVLAHEIAHVTQRHALKIIARGEFVSGASTLALKYSGDARQVQAQLAQFDSGIADVLKTIFEKGFDSKTEFSADKAGRGLAATVGYAPGALRQVLVDLQQAKSDPNVTFSTHPPLADRIKNLPTDSALAKPTGG